MSAANATAGAGAPPGTDMNAVNAEFKKSQDFQMALMIAQNRHSTVMAAIQSMKAAFDKIRA
jgi:hypothetical protein